MVWIPLVANVLVEYKSVVEKSPLMESLELPALYCQHSWIHLPCPCRRQAPLMMFSWWLVLLVE